MLSILGFYKKIFEWLVANELLSNSKNISPLYLHFFLYFLHNLFFSTDDVFSTSSWTKIHSIKLSSNGHQKIFLSIYWRNILFIYLFIYLFMYLCIYLFIYLFIHLFIYLFIHLFIYLFRQDKHFSNYRHCYQHVSCVKLVRCKLKNF